MSLQAGEYFVANGGDDGNTGSQGAPLATIAHALTHASNGDTVYLQRGSIFRESGLTLGRGRYMTLYGDPADPLPVLTGSVPATNFTQWVSDPRIYCAALQPGLAIEQVYVNGSRATLARYPDTGWLRTDAGSQDNLIVDAALTNRPGAAPGRWNNAQVRWRKWSWWYETRPITNDNGQGSLFLGGSTAISGLVGIGSGYYIDNSLVELDAPGEWFWDTNTGTLYLYPPEGASPASMVVEAACRGQGITVNGGRLERINVRYYTGTGVAVNATNSTVRGCVIDNIGDTGLSGGWDIGGSRIEYCTFRDILNVGISWNENPAGAGGSVMEYNRLERIGAAPGLGGSGPWHAAGVIISNAQEGNNGVRFRYNRLNETGYAGIILGADRQVAERNVFIRCMATLNDGAAIYCNAHTNYIRENIILDTIGDLDSSQPWTPLGHGIWPEFLSNFTGSEIVGNTVFGSGGDGLFLGNNFNCLICTNTFLGNRRGGLSLGYGEEGRSDGLTNQNHVMQGNIIGMGALPWRTTRNETLTTWAMTNDHALSFTVYADRDLDYGAMTGTTFLTTNGQDLVCDSDRAEYTIGQWQSAESAWADPTPTMIQGRGYLFINDTESTVDFPVPPGVMWCNLQGASVSNELAIAPYRSVVLLATNGTTTNLPAYFLGTDCGVVSCTNWMKLKCVFGTNAVSNADPDQDGLWNFAEYYYDLDPEVWNSRPGLTCRYDNASASFVAGHSRRRYLEGASGVMRRSFDLSAWSNLVSCAETATDVPGAPAVQSVETFIPAGTNNHFFVRLAVGE